MALLRVLCLMGLPLVLASSFAQNVIPDFPFPPPKDLANQAAYNNKVYVYLQQCLKQNLGYRTWQKDKYWRLTGRIESTTVPIDQQGTIDAANIDRGPQLGVHPPSRIYYSPEVYTWMTGGYAGKIPDGAVIIKETSGWTGAVVSYADSVPVAERIALAKSGETKTVAHQIGEDLTPSSWVVMVRNSKASLDGWYWFDFEIPDQFETEMPNNFSGLSAVTKGFGEMPTSPSEGWQKAGFSPAPGKSDYWTGNSLGVNIYPSAGYGYYCYNCHASAKDQLTFSDIDNVTGDNTIFPIELAFTFEKTKPEIDHTPHKGDEVATSDAPNNPYVPPRDSPDPDFLETFKKYAPESWASMTWADAWDTRLPARTWSHNVMNAENTSQFITSDQCQACHDASILNSSLPNMMVEDRTRSIAPYSEWSVSMMGLAGRDPIFYSQLEGETNYYADSLTGFITNTCFKCHGVMGQRQYHIDEQPGDFTRAMAAAWPEGEHKEYAAYGSLARDGVSCTVCHHIIDEGLGTPETFTGDFKLGPPDQIYGPYEDVVTKPMEHSVGITPQYGSWMPSSRLCVSCHTIQLPVYYKDGKPVMANGEPKVVFEQTTYLEWLNSDFNDENGRTDQTQSCQDCHMKQSFEGHPITSKIANIEAEACDDCDFPPMERALPNEEVTLTPRKPFFRHQLAGINLFGLEMFSQFPLVLGIMQLDFQTFFYNAMLEAQEAGEQMAQHETVDIDVTTAQTGNTVEATVTVHNKVGHFFPSGVGFRRAFINVTYLDGLGNKVWASGSTDDVGVILDNDGEPLPTEFLEKDPATGLKYQPHYTVIENSSQVQIYESIHLNPYGEITTSFLGLDKHIKDNRIRPLGWSPTGPYAEVTMADGNAKNDPDYTKAEETGKDTVVYRIDLGAKAASVKKVRVRVFYQATPPYYLMQRFQLGKLNENATFGDIKRFWYLASYLNTRDQASRIQNWRIGVGDVTVAL